MQSECSCRPALHVEMIQATRVCFQVTMYSYSFLYKTLQMQLELQAEFFLTAL